MLINLASRGGKRAQKTPNTTKSSGGHVRVGEKDPQFPQYAYPQKLKRSKTKINVAWIPAAEAAVD